MCDRSEEGYTPFVPAPRPDDGTPDAALFSAALSGDVAAAKEALAAGANTECTEYYETPLVRTSRNGNAGVMEVLIAAGASIKGAQYADQTPLHYTAYFCNPECVSLLLKANADVEKRDSKGNTALEAAEEASCGKSKKDKARKAQCVALLKDNQK